SPHAPPRHPRFPYTTLFRSRLEAQREDPHEEVADLAELLLRGRSLPDPIELGEQLAQRVDGHLGLHGGHGGERAGRASRVERARSEEHTSELQSRENLVCRL